MTKPTVVDFHTHFVPPALLDFLERHGDRIGLRLLQKEVDGQILRFPDGGNTGMPFFPELIEFDRRLALQQQMGINVQIMSCWNDVFGYFLSAEGGAELSRVTNEALQASAAGQPGTIVPMGTVPLQSPYHAADEVRFLARSLGIRSIQIGATVNNAFLDHDSFDVFWRACQDEQVAVFIHPTRTEPTGRYGRYFAGNIIGNPVETTLAAMEILLGGVLDRFGGLSIVLAHGGGFTPYQIGRMERGYTSNAQARSKAVMPPRESFRRLYFDTLVYDPRALRYLVSIAGADHVLFGTDIPFPIADRNAVEETYGALEDLPEEQIRDIFGGNAARLLGFTLPLREAPPPPVRE